MNAIKDIRMRLGWSREEMAGKLHVAVATVSRWETGDRLPSTYSYWQLRRLAKAAGIGEAHLRMERFYPDPEAI